MRITNAVSFLCQSQGFDVLNYLDDFQGVESCEEADDSFLATLLAELGLQESVSKACPPSTVMTCLGVQFNTVDMTMSVTQTRLSERKVLVSMCNMICCLLCSVYAPCAFVDHPLP